MMLGTGFQIGEMSFFEGGIRNADVVSGDKCRLAVISFDDITELASYYPNIIDRFVRALGNIIYFYSECDLFSCMRL